MTDKPEHANTPTDPLVELNRLLKEAEQKGEKLSDEGRVLTQSGQSVTDLARATQPIIRFVPSSYLEPLISDWEVVNKQADDALAHVTGMSSASLTSTTTNTTYTTSMFFEPRAILPNVAAAERPAVEASLARLQQIVSRTADENEVLSLMKDLRLNRAAKGKKSPVSLFDTAHRAFENPVSSDNPVSTSLVPIRESIRLTIDQLLKKRPAQEEVKTERAKILSIGRQLGRETIPHEVIESWADQWEDLLDKLSPAKEADMSRDNWHFHLRQGTLFLKSFLEGLDRNKVKHKRR